MTAPPDSTDRSAPAAGLHPAGLRLRTARRGARAAAWLSRVTGRGSGGVIGGRVLLRIAPDAPRLLSRGREVFLVSGTNGKTTTTALLTAALGAAGPVDSNADGANTPPGFATALSEGAAPRVVLETDEGWVPWAVTETGASTVLLLNLSRDQLSRHHEVGKLASTWRRSLGSVQTAVANADDPDTVWPALAARQQVWVAAGQNWTQDSVVCPSCGDRCERDGTGWQCQGCGLARPTPDWWLEGEELVSTDVRVPLALSLPGAFNRANAAMAVAAAAARGVDPRAAAEAMRTVGDVAGRFAVQQHGDRQVRLLLAKNPAGWLEMLDMVDGEDGPLVLAFNSEGVDGRDPSWLYDVSFRAVAHRPVVVIGRRATDMRVRLAMDGIEPVEVRRDLVDALTALPPGRVDVLANYTAFQDARKELARAARQ